MKISILTPSFNSAKYIERAIQSVLNQDYENWEHIIVDGGSTDGTIDILKKYTHLTWVSEPDEGQSDAMNKAFKMSTGEIIVYLNADDSLFTNVFSFIIKAFHENNSDMVIGRTTINMNGRVIKREPTKSYDDILKYWLHRFPANPVAYYYKRVIQETVGAFPVDNHYTMDYWFLLRAGTIAQITYIPVELGIFYLHDDAKTLNNNVQMNLKKEYFDFINQASFSKKVNLYFIWLIGIVHTLKTRYGKSILRTKIWIKKKLISQT